MSLNDSVETQSVGDPMTVALAAGLAFSGVAKAARDETIEARDAVVAQGSDIADAAAQIAIDKTAVASTVSVVEAKRAGAVLAANAAAASADAAAGSAAGVDGVVASAATSAQSADASADAAAASATAAGGFADDAGGYALQAQSYADDATDAAGVATTKATEAAASAASISGGPVTSVAGLTGAIGAPALKSALGLGTAAAKDAGTSAGNVLLLDGGARVPTANLPDTVPLLDGTRAMLGKLLLAASAASRACLNFATGTDPSAPIEGDVWYAGSGVLRAYVAGAVHRIPFLGLVQSWGAQQTFLKPIRLSLGATADAPGDGDLRIALTGLFVRYSGAEQQMATKADVAANAAAVAANAAAIQRRQVYGNTRGLR